MKCTGWGSFFLRNKPKGVGVDMADIPEAPQILNEVGKQFWETYCNVFSRRGDLTDQHQASIESLCYLEQQRVEIQETISEKGLFNNFTTDKGDEIIQSNGLDKVLKRVVSQIRYLKSDLKLNPEAVKQSKKSNLNLVQKNF